MKLIWVLLLGVAFTQAMPTDFPEDEDHTFRWHDSQESPVSESEASTGLPDSSETTAAFTGMEKQDLTTINEELILTSPLPHVETALAATSTTPKAVRATSNLRSSPTTRRKESPEKNKLDTTTTAKPTVAKTTPNKQSSFGTSASLGRETSTPALKKNTFEEESPGPQRGKNENLSDFLRRRKEERHLATTEPDPFAAFFAKGTTTRPSFKTQATSTTTTTTEDSSFSSSGRSFSSGNNRLGNRRNASFGRSGQSQSFSTSTTERPTQTTRSRNRFTGFPRNNNKATRGATTTSETLMIDQPEPVVETSTKPKSFPKRPSAFRPVANSISRRRDQTSTPASISEAPENVADSPVDEVPKFTTRRAGTRRLRGNRL